MIGMARVGDRDPNQPALLLSREFRFTQQGRYRVLSKGSEQYEAMEGHNKQYGLPIYYLLYNPHTMPLKVCLPHAKDVRVRAAPVLGTRVVPMEKMHGYLQLKTDENYSPTLRGIRFVIGPERIAEKPIRLAVGAFHGRPAALVS